MRRVMVAAAAIAASCSGSDPDAGLPDPVGAFPDGFLWGAAIAPYQVESGLVHTDWHQWDTGGCGHCAPDDAGDGPDFLTHYRTDLANAASYGHNAIRLGIDWSRLFPTAAQFPDAPDPDAVARYHDVIDEARSRGLEVMVTLHHFATPVWIQDLTAFEAGDGWEDPATAERFAAFAGWAAAEFGGDVDLWITINEPFFLAFAGWIGGEFPPGKSFDVEGALAVIDNLLRAHALAYDAIHAADPTAMVSIAHHARVYRPRDPADPDHVRATDLMRYLGNDLFLDALVRGDVDRNFDLDLDDEGDTTGDPALAGRLDYIGLNYYGLFLIIPSTERNFPFIGLPLQTDLDRHGVDAPSSDFGWAIYPEGLREVLDDLAAYDLPILVTENGLADAVDAQRPRFLVDHLYALAQAIDAGADVRGYFHWSLIDNFEWSSGFCPRFGLFHVDLDDPARPRRAGEGADVYRRIIEANTVPPSLFRDYPDYPGAGSFCPRLPL